MPWTGIDGHSMAWSQTVMWGNTVVWGNVVFDNQLAWGQPVVWGINSSLGVDSRLGRHRISVWDDPVSLESDKIIRADRHDRH